MKKIISLALMAVMLVGFNITVFAAEESSIDPYVQVLAEINEEYGQQLILQDVDASKISLEEFEVLMRDMAAQQKELKEYVANREEYISDGVNTNLARSTTKTVEQECWNDSSFYVKATYDVNGTHISNPRNISVGSSIPFGTYTCNVGYPTTQIIDSGRTLTVTAYGTFDNYFAGVHISNVYVYTEFYYDS